MYSFPSGFQMRLYLAAMFESIMNFLSIFNEFPFHSVTVKSDCWGMTHRLDGAQVAMLARDEEQLLQKHLVHWRGIGDAFLIGLDSRNKEG